MVPRSEFGDPMAHGYPVVAEPFVWRGFQRFAFFRRHPSGRELICVVQTGYRAGQKLPRR